MNWLSFVLYQRYETIVAILRGSGHWSKVVSAQVRQMRLRISYRVGLLDLNKDVTTWSSIYIKRCLTSKTNVILGSPIIMNISRL